MIAKRLTLEVSPDQYQFLRKEADSLGTSISGLMREMLEEHRRRPKKRKREDYKNDPFYKMGGSFEGPGDLSVNHDDYLYGGKDGGKIPL